MKRGIGVGLILSPLAAITALATIVHGWAGFLGCLIGFGIVFIIMAFTVAGAMLITGWRWWK